jgi:hypothetical protein
MNCLLLFKLVACEFYYLSTDKKKKYPMEIQREKQIFMMFFSTRQTDRKREERKQVSTG